ncbi:TPA: hypothetical protein I7738_07735 [Vibrio vulnificus]|nr:hypothetical protein [Vibrio vulnificus]
MSKKTPNIKRGQNPGDPIQGIWLKKRRNEREDKRKFVSEPFASKQLASKQLASKQLASKQLASKQLASKQLASEPFASEPRWPRRELSVLRTKR